VLAGWSIGLVCNAVGGCVVCMIVVIASSEGGGVWIGDWGVEVSYRYQYHTAKIRVIDYLRQMSNLRV